MLSVPDFAPHVPLRLPRVPSWVLGVFLTVLGIMTLYEVVKQAMYPDITLWQSHLVTIGFSSLLTAAVVYVVSQRRATRAATTSRLEGGLDERKRVEATLNAIFLDTATSTGEDFFRQFVRSLATSLHVKYAFVSECVDGTKTKVRTLAFWQGEAMAENIEYAVAGTPCEAVFAGERAFWPRDVQTRFPKDQDLSTLEAEAYLGVPLRDSRGAVIGHAVIMDTRPMAEDPFARPIMELVALRAAGELQRLRAEQALHASEAQRIEAFRQSDALKSALLGSVSHEFRTPLTVIKSSLTALFLPDAQQIPSVKAQLIREIHEEIEHLSMMVENLLKMSHVEAGGLRAARECYPVEELIEGALHRVLARTRGREFEITAPHDLPCAHVDGVQIQHVLLNLLDNAIKYSAEGSPLRITVHPRGEDLEVRVLSVGSGIPPADVTRVFRRFYRGEASRQKGIRGTGLGLALCKGIVEGHGGRIWVESEGQTTTVAFTLPKGDVPCVKQHMN